MANAWNQVGSLRGPQGPKGDTGATGSRGGGIRVASVDVADISDVAFSALAPSDGVQVGDIVVDAKGAVRTVATVNAGASTAHVGPAVSGVTLKGPKGDTGEAGPKGNDGTSINVKGSVANESALPAGASVGDTYVTTDNGHMWVKTAMSGSSQWTDLGEMKGPKGDKGERGDAGATGATGATGPQGPAGPGITFGQGAPSGASQEGAVYIDTADGFKVYQYGTSE